MRSLDERDRVLRAAVYAAFDAKNTDAYSTACARVVAIDALWPLIEYEHAIEKAEALVDQSQQGRQ